MTLTKLEVLSVLRPVSNVSKSEQLMLYGVLQQDAKFPGEELVSFSQMVEN